MNWVSQNLGAILGFLAAGGVAAAFAKSFRWARPYERVVITGPRGLVWDEKNGHVREYLGIVFRPLGFYRMSLVNIRTRVDNILLDGVMRPTNDGHRERWHFAGAAEWRVKEGYVYLACEWNIDDIGEWARGMIQRTILNYLESVPVSMELDTASIYRGCYTEEVAKEFLKHGVEWIDLLPNTNTLADSEIQGQAIRRVAKAIERWVSVLRGEL